MKPLAGERLPHAFVDLDAMARNERKLRERAGKKRLRWATKSVRSVGVLRRVVRPGPENGDGLMTYSAEETLFLAGEGFDDFLLAYPTHQPRALEGLGRLAAKGARLALVVDGVEGVEAAARAGRKAGAALALVLDLDLSYRVGALGRAVHLGVRRSPIRTPGQALELARRIRSTEGVRLAGLMAYEAQIAGLSDASWSSRLLKRWSRPEARARRAAVVDALRAEGFDLELVNGGGTGSLAWTAEETCITEVTAGSGLYCPHLFDGYRGLDLEPAAFFALEVVRSSDEGFVTCLGGGYVASGAAGADRLPRPVWPRGLELVALEGAGEVQTPLRARGEAPPLGSAVVFRHAKAGELAERFNELLLVSEGRIVERAPTYRGEGRCWL